jgi:hypothetical protein
MPEAAENRIAVGAQRRGIDGAEHSARIERVMASGSSSQGTRKLRHEDGRDSSVRFRENALQIASRIGARFLRSFSLPRET